MGDMTVWRTSRRMSVNVTIPADDFAVVHAFPLVPMFRYRVYCSAARGQMQFSVSESMASLYGCEYVRGAMYPTKSVCVVLSVVRVMMTGVWRQSVVKSCGMNELVRMVMVAVEVMMGVKRSSGFCVMMMPSGGIASSRVCDGSESVRMYRLMVWFSALVMVEWMYMVWRFLMLFLGVDGSEG